MDVPDYVPRNARAEFRARLATFAEDHPELSAPDAAALFARTLPDTERDLVEAFLGAEAHNILAWEMRAQFSRNRSSIFAAVGIGNPERPGLATLGEKAKLSLYERITQWHEYVPSIDRTDLLLKLTRPALLESAQFDARNLAHYGLKMILKTRLAAGLTDDVTEVGSVYTPEHIANMIESIQSEMNRGNFRIAIKPVSPLPRPRSVSRQGDGRYAQGPQADRGVAAS